MLPVWPFRSRSIRHRTFGTLRPVRNGNYWRARVPLPHARRPVDLHISAGRGGPTAEQERLFLDLSGRYPAVYASALAAVHGEYQRVRRVHAHLRWPAADAAADLEHLTPLEQIWLDDDRGERFVLSFAHRDDRDHSFHVFFEGDRVQSVASER